MNKTRAMWAAGICIVLVAAAFLLPSTAEETSDIFVSPRRGPFQVTVTATGELQAKNSVSIYGPAGARQARLFEMKLLRLVPESAVFE